MLFTAIFVSTMTLSYPYNWAPGMLDPTCTVQKVCQKGYTKTVRPPVSYTNKLKKQQIEDHPEIDCNRGCEEDHVVPLEACGNPTNPENLSPQPYPEAYMKDKVENWYHWMICHNDWTPNQVLQDISNWKWHFEEGNYCSNPECKEDGYLLKSAKEEVNKETIRELPGDIPNRRR